MSFFPLPCRTRSNKDMHEGDKFAACPVRSTGDCNFILKWCWCRLLKKPNATQYDSPRSSGLVLCFPSLWLNHVQDWVLICNIHHNSLTLWLLYQKSRYLPMSRVLLLSSAKMSHSFAAVLFSPDYYTSLAYYENNWGAVGCPCLRSFQNTKAIPSVSTLLD